MVEMMENEWRKKRPARPPQPPPSVFILKLSSLRDRKCKQLLRLNFRGVEKFCCRFLWKTESKSPEMNGGCNRRHIKYWKFDIILSC